MKALLIILSLFSGVAMNAQSVEQDTIKSQPLDEVVVMGEKSQIRGEDGVMVVDLPAIVKDKPVSNVLEALGYLPGVVNNDGMIGLAAAANVTIILNGELTNMPVENLYQLLYSTPVDRLKNVELFYSAPAKYHVDGAVINVVLKTPSPFDGLQGQLRAGYSQAHYGSYGGGLAATYAINKWTFDLTYNLSRSKSWNREENLSAHLLNGVRTLIEEDSRRTHSSIDQLIYASAAYKFSDTSRINITYNGQIDSDIKAHNLTTGSLGNYVNSLTYSSPTSYHNIGAKYVSGFGMTVGMDYTNYEENLHQTLYVLPGYIPQAISYDKQRINKYHGYIDQMHDFKGWEINYGIEYQQSDDHSSQKYELPAQSGYNGVTKEEVADAYVGLEHSFPWGLSFNLSAKGEYFHNDYQHNWNLIPQFGATYYKTPKSIFQLNFTTKRVYPAYWALHSGTTYLGAYSMVIGNPALQPYLNYSGQLTYIFRQKYMATFYVQYGDKATVQLPYQSPDEQKLIYQTINMDYKRIIGLNIYLPFTIGGLWTINATANIFNQREKAARFHDISFDHEKWIFYGNLSNSFRFGKQSPLSLSVDFSYISPSLQGIGNLSGLWSVDAGVKWQFGKKRCCELDLKTNDIFDTWSPTLTINQSGQDYRMKVHDMTRNLKLTFIWRFNGFKPKDTTFDSSRFGTGL